VGLSGEVLADHLVAALPADAGLLNAPKGAAALETTPGAAGCPLVAAAADTAATSEQLRQVLRRAFDGWLEPLSESPADLGVPPERSGHLAIVVIAALEGAIILARISAT
jgi:hypothetical protein